MTAGRATARSAPIAVAVVSLMIGLVVASSVSARAPGAEDGGRSAGTKSASPAPAVTTAPPPATPRRPDPVVAVVGDSLAYSAATPLFTALRELGGNPVLRVAPGRRIPVWGLDGQISPGLDEVRKLRSSAPAVWVVQLGTNDVAAEPFSRARYRELVTAMLDTIGPGAPVVWVNIHRDDRPAESRAFDDTLRLVARTWPGLTIADWDAVAQREAVLAADGIHLGYRGTARFVATIAGAVSRAGSAAGALP